jgi:hypothetical protein
MTHRFEYGAIGGLNRHLHSFIRICDNVELARSNPLAVSIFGPGHCLLNVETSYLRCILQNQRPTRSEFHEIFVNAYEMARKSPLSNELPLLCEGVPRLDVLAALFIFTMQEPFPLYRLITDIFSLTGRPELFKELCPFLKLILIALRSIPPVKRFSELHTYEGPLFFGFDSHPSCTSISEIIERHFPVGKDISLAAPIFCSPSADVVVRRYPEGVCVQIANAGAVKLVPGVLSSFSEEEYLPAFPLTVRVNSCESVGATWLVEVEVVTTSIPMCYLSAYTPKRTSDEEEDRIGQNFREKKYLTVDVSSSAMVASESVTSSVSRASSVISCPSLSALKASDFAAIVGFLRTSLCALFSIEAFILFAGQQH